MSRSPRYFDAARSYGKAEEFLGEWLRARNIPTSEVMVGSKWGYTYTADWQIDTQVRRRLHSFQKIHVFCPYAAPLSSGWRVGARVLIDMAEALVCRLMHACHLHLKHHLGRIEYCGLPWARQNGSMYVCSMHGSKHGVAAASAPSRSRH